MAFNTLECWFLKSVERLGLAVIVFWWTHANLLYIATECIGSGPREQPWIGSHQ